MDQINIKKLNSLSELKNQVNKKQLILCDDIQNTFFIINFDNTQKIGVAYYDYGIPPSFQYSIDGTLLYIGIGKNFLCISIYEKKILINDSLQSIFYELLYDSNKNHICVICELDIYCYYSRIQKWKIGFRDIIVNYNIIDDSKIAISCDNNIEYIFFLENGKMAE